MRERTWTLQTVVSSFFFVFVCIFQCRFVIIYIYLEAILQTRCFSYSLLLFFFSQDSIFIQPIHIFHLEKKNKRSNVKLEFQCFCHLFVDRGLIVLKIHKFMLIYNSHRCQKEFLSNVGGFFSLLLLHFRCSCCEFTSLFATTILEEEEEEENWFLYVCVCMENENFPL